MRSLTQGIERIAVTALMSAGILLAQATPSPSSEIDKHPDFHDEIPNKTQSGQQASTNSTLQKDRDGNMGIDYLGWLGLIGLAGLFGLNRGVNAAPEAGRDR